MKMYVKIKELGPVGGRVSDTPPRSANEANVSCVNSRYKNGCPGDARSNQRQMSNGKLANVTSILIGRDFLFGITNNHCG